MRVLIVLTLVVLGAACVSCKQPDHGWPGAPSYDDSYETLLKRLVLRYMSNNDIDKRNTVDFKDCGKYSNLLTRRVEFQIH